MATALPSLREVGRGITEALSSAAAGASVSGRYPRRLVRSTCATLQSLARSRQTPPAALLHQFWFADWGMDWLYDRLFVRPVVWMATANKGDVIDSIYDGLARLAALCYRVLSLTETGKLRWYAAWIAGGSAVLVAIVVFL